MTQDESIPAGLCQCGCGSRTTIARQNEPRFGHRRGEPVRFVSGHNGRRITVLEHYDVDEGGCWIWRGAKAGANGYGLLTNTGRGRYTHRFFYEHFKGPIPEGFQIDHLCRNRSCCNPDHLEAVTATENVRRSTAARLTAADVVAIRRSGESRSALAAKYGVGVGAIRLVLIGATWQDVPMES